MPAPAIDLSLFLKALRYLDFLQRASGGADHIDHDAMPKPDVVETTPDAFKVNPRIVDMLTVTTEHQSCWARYTAMIYISQIERTLTKVVIPSGSATVDANEFAENLFFVTMLEYESQKTDNDAAQNDKLGLELKALLISLQKYFLAFADGTLTADDLNKTA